jgi:transposase
VEVVVGIDISKANLDVFVLPGAETWRTTNDEPGITELATRLEGLDPEAVILEATGGLEGLVTSILLAAGLPVHVVNPRQVRDFARSTGQLAKTDALDARVLAQFGQAVRPELRLLPDEATQGLRALVTRRQQLREMLATERIRRHSASRSVRPSLEANIEWLRKLVDDLDDELKKTIQSSPAWREKDDLLRSVPGIGPVVSAVLIARCQSSDALVTSRSQRSWAWLRSTGTAVPYVDGGRSGEDAPRSGRSSTWVLWPRPVRIPAYVASTNACVQPANPRNSRSQHA